MSTYGRRTHSWDYHTNKCKRCGMDRPKGGRRVGNCPTPRQVPYSRIREEKAKVWDEASTIALANGCVDLARHFERIATRIRERKP